VLLVASWCYWLLAIVVGCYLLLAIEHCEFVPPYATMQCEGDHNSAKGSIDATQEDVKDQ